MTGATNMRTAVLAAPGFPDHYKRNDGGQRHEHDRRVQNKRVRWQVEDAVHCVPRSMCLLPP